MLSWWCRVCLFDLWVACVLGFGFWLVCVVCVCCVGRVWFVFVVLGGSWVAGFVLF